MGIYDESDQTQWWSEQLIAELGVYLLIVSDSETTGSSVVRKELSPTFKQHIKNNKDTNQYKGWPDVIEMEGCIPQKQNWCKENGRICTLLNVKL